MMFIPNTRLKNACDDRNFVQPVDFLNGDTLGKFSLFIDHIQYSADCNRVLPVATLFKQRFSLQGIRKIHLRTALDMTISTSMSHIDFTELCRLELASVLLDCETLALTGKSYLMMLDAALASSTANSFRSMRLYSRSLLSFWRKYGDNAFQCIVKHAKVSEALVYALVDLDDDGAGDAIYFLPVRDLMERALTSAYSHLPVYNVVRSMHDTAIERIEAMTLVGSCRVLQPVQMPVKLLQ